MTEQYEDGTFGLVERSGDYEIPRRMPGFEYTPVLLGRISSYLVVDGSGSSGVFAFMYRFGTPRREPEPDEEELAQMAVDVIRQSLNLAVVPGGSPVATVNS